MKLGDIFRNITKKDPTKLSLEEIEEFAIKEAKFKKYGKNIVIARGNVFKNKSVSIDKLFDERLSSMQR